MSYPNGLLSTRSVIKHGVSAIVPPEGRVINVMPNIENCPLTILCSPKLGASFVMYVGTANPGGGTLRPFAADPDIESFIWVMDGEGALTVSVDGKTETMGQGGYAYAPAGVGIDFKNKTDKALRFILYKQRYVPHPNPERKPWVVFGNTNTIDVRLFDDMENAFLTDLLPVDEAFDMNFHTLSFAPGACHPFIETHVQEHGAYIYEGEGRYLVGEDWVGVQKEDFIWFGPYTQQACYGTGRGNLSYIYSKDCHRDADI